MTMSAPDGRTLLFEVREGEQHDLWGVAKGYVTAFKLHSSAVKQIVDAVWAKLPPAVFVLPVTVSQDTTLQLRVTEVRHRHTNTYYDTHHNDLQLLFGQADLHDDNLIEVVNGFCKSHDIPIENAPRLAKSVFAGMYPSSISV